MEILQSLVEVARRDLWLTEEDQIRIILNNEVLEGKDVTAEALDVPGDCTESDRVQGIISITYEG